MKGFVKFVAIAAGLLLITAGIGGILLGFQAERSVALALEQALSYVFQSEVVLDKVEILPFRGLVVVTGLNVANPDAFRKGTAFGCERLTAELDLKSLTSASPVIKKLELDGVVINIRHELGDGTNIRRLIENATRFSAAEEPNTPRPARTAFFVRELECRSAAAALSTNIIPNYSTDVAIAPFMLTNLGDSKAVNAGQIGAIFLRSLMKESIKGLLKPAADLLREELGILRGEMQPIQVPEDTEGL